MHVCTYTATLNGLTENTAYCAAVSATAVGPSGNVTGQWGSSICTTTLQNGIKLSILYKLFIMIK